MTINKTNVINYFITIMCCILLISCGGREVNYSMYKNRSLYNIHIGDTFMLVFDENSCCINKRLNLESLKSVKLIKDTILAHSPEDCVGCSRYFGLVFKGVAAGQDTLKFARHGAGMKWEEIRNDTNRYERQFFKVSVSQ